MEGWLVTKDEGKRATGGRFTWKLREDSDIKEDHKRLASDLMDTLDRRVQSAVSTILGAFDAAGLVGLQCGRWRREVENRARQVRYLWRKSLRGCPFSCF